MRGQTHKQSKSFRAYKVILHIYPKSHRLEYGDQMVQTLEDMLNDQHTSVARFVTWVRVGMELPLNVIEEHINNLEGKSMKDILGQNGKRNAIILSALIAIVIAGSTGIALNRNGTYQPTSLSNLASSKKVACLQNQEDKNLIVPEKESTQVANTVAMSITDVPAGTNVDVHLKTYSSSSSTGTAVYQGKYGSYNFTASKTSGSQDDYTGGWKVTKFSVCEP